MMKHLSLIGAALAMGATAVIPTSPASAQRYSHHRSYQPHYRGYNQRYHRNYRHDYRGRYSDYRGCRDNGTGGTIIGAIAGGLLGNEIAGRGDQAVGTILGAGAGALAGRAIDRSDRPNYCR